MPRFTLLRHEIGSSFRRRDPSTGQNGVSSEHVGENAVENIVENASGIASGPIHWDWLFETDEQAGPDSHTLKTFATDELTTFERGSAERISVLSSNAIQLPPHRKLYLDFEGDIGHNRGVVQQIATGWYEAIKVTEERFECRLTPQDTNRLGGFFPASLVLQRTEVYWHLRCASCAASEE